MGLLLPNRRTGGENCQDEVAVTLHAARLAERRSRQQTSKPDTRTYGGGEPPCDQTTSWEKNPPLEILLLEDNPHDTDAFRDALKQCDRQSKLVDLIDGEQAIDYLSSNGEHRNAPLPDIIITSLIMPKIRGHDVLNWIKSQSRLACIPVLLLTSSENEEDMVRAYQAGAAGFFTKPIDKEGYIPIAQAIVNYWATAWTLPYI